MPASPMTYAVPSGRCSLRNFAVASADVQIADSGRSMPARRSRAHRSRGVKIELLVSTRNLRPLSCSRAMNSGAPGIAFSSWTSTPSMSVSQDSIGFVIVAVSRAASVMLLLSTRVMRFEESPDQLGGVDFLGLRPWHASRRAVGLARQAEPLESSVASRGTIPADRGRWDAHNIEAIVGVQRTTG